MGQLQFSGAAALIIIRRTAGEEDDIDELITAIMDNVHRYREAGITRGADFNFSVDYEEGLAAYLAGERERLLAIVCTDNPYAAVWQPAEGIYERFAAAGEN